MAELASGLKKWNEKYVKELKDLVASQVDVAQLWKIDNNLVPFLREWLGTEVALKPSVYRKGDLWDKTVKEGTEAKLEVCIADVRLDQRT